MVITRDGIILEAGNGWEGIYAPQLVTWDELAAAREGDSWEAVDPSNCARGTYSETLTVCTRYGQGRITAVLTSERQCEFRPDEEPLVFERQIEFDL
jgi:hypothetical protein